MIAVVAIFGSPFSGKTRLARMLAGTLDYRCVESQVVIERAAAWGASQDDLRNRLSKPPGLSDRLSHKRRIHLTLLQAALAEEIREGNVVCHGNLGVFLPNGDGSLLRVLILAPLEFRINEVRERLKLGRAEALDCIHRVDRDREKWLRHLHGANTSESSRCDLLIDLEHMDLERACGTIARIVKRNVASPFCPAWRPALEALALSSRVKVALARASATVHLEVDVSADAGSVSISGKVPSYDDVREVERVARLAPGVTEVETNDLMVSNPEMAPAFAVPLRMPRLFWAGWYAMGFSLLALIVATTLLLFRGDRVRTFTGVITDTRCVNSHIAATAAPDSECVRACVKRDSAVKYALYHGQRLYILSDQLIAEGFAAQRVEVTGAIDHKSGQLRVQSIRRSS
ncbi:MAG: cytidylate kinase family protein [Planctomycetota bacterium]